MNEPAVPSLISQVEAAVSGAIDRVLPELAGADPLVRRSEHAGFQANAALALAKRARVRPAELAATSSEVDADQLAPEEVRCRRKTKLIITDLVRSYPRGLTPMVGVTRLARAVGVAV